MQKQFFRGLLLLHMHKIVDLTFFGKKKQFLCFAQTAVNSKAPFCKNCEKEKFLLDIIFQRC